MKKTILMITVVTLLSGCGVFNKVFKHKIVNKTLEETSKAVKSDVNTQIIDNSVTTITEKADTTVTTPEVKGRSESRVNFADIQNGLTIIDDEFVNLYQIYNPVDSTLKTGYTLKPQKVPVKIDKKTEVRNDINTDQSVKQESKEEAKKETKHTDAVVDRKADYKVIFIIVGLIVLLLLVRWVFKKRGVI